MSKLTQWYRLPGSFVMLVDFCIVCACASWGETESWGSPDVSPPALVTDRLELIRRKLPTFFVEGMVPAKTFKDVIRNDGKRWGNLCRECPDMTERFLVNVDFVNMLRPQNENDILVYEGGERFYQPGDDKALFSNIQIFLGHCAVFCTDDIRLWEMARDITENKTGSTSIYRISAAGRALEFMGMCRVPQTAPYLEKAVTEAFWFEFARKAPQVTAAFQTGEIDVLRYGAVLGISNLPHVVAIPILEKTAKGISTSDHIYEVTWRALDEMWRRKNGALPLHEYGMRYEYPPGGWERRPTAYPSWIYGEGGRKIEWPFGQPPEDYEPPTLDVYF